MRHAFRRAAIPLAAYYAVTLAFPFANGAAGPAFFRHAAVVLMVPLVLILLLWAVRALPTVVWYSVWRPSRSPSPFPTISSGG